MPRIKMLDGTIRIADAVEDYLSHKLCSNITEVTYNNYECVLKVILPKFIDMDKPIWHITEAYTSISRAELKESTKNSYLVILKMMVKHYNEQYSDKLPLPVVKQIESNKRGYTDEEIAKLIVKPRKWKNFCEYRDWVMVNLLLDTGIRMGTLMEIKIKDIDFDNHFIACRHTKNKKPLLVPLSKFMEKELRDYLKVRQGDKDSALFVNWYGDKLTKQTTESAIRLYNTSRGVSYHSVHAFRHTFARKYLIDMHGDMFKLQKLLGHSSMDMTMHYANITINDLVDDFRQESPVTRLQKNHIKL